jgi:ribonucleoside-diphosphate reductase alpha chain
VFDFLDMQTEHGDIRLKSYDVFPQLTIPDIFMERDKENGKWTTFCPFEVKQKLDIDIRGLYGKDFNDAYSKIEAAHEQGKLKVAKQYQARDLFKTFMRTQFETGLPYIAFTDTINEVNPNKYHEQSIGIPAVNLCTESYSNVMPDKMGHVCNLCSINLCNIDGMEELADVSRMSTRMLDYGINLTNNPVEITKTHNQEFRTIGVGQMGLHDYLAKNWLNFSNLDVISEISECIEYNSIIESIDLARRFGSFGAFKESMWANGEMIKMFDSHSKGAYNWKELQSKIDEFGIRNSQLTSPAPTTSTSIYQDASASILPAYSAFFSEDNKNGSLLVASKYLALNPIAYGKTFAKHTATEIIDVASAAQKFIDTGISMELIFDQNRENFTAKELYDAVHYAHKNKIKAIYYIRSIKKNSTLETKEEACAACSG